MIKVLRSGPQTTVQDAGRRARALGIPASGAADPVALRLANALVGNPSGAAALEYTMLGPTLLFTVQATIAVCGGAGEIWADAQPLRPWQAHTIQAGQTLHLGPLTRGWHGVLALHGGLNVPAVFESRSTNLHTGFGGLHGRSLQAGDCLDIASLPGSRLDSPAPNSPTFRPCVPPPQQLSPHLWTPLGPTHQLRVLPTAEANADWLAALTQKSWTVSPQLNRMGIRLTEPLPLPAQPGRVSLPTVPGLVQLPPDGRLTFLLPDAGTHGGYPAPLVVAAADISRLGQLRPGDRLHFRVIDDAEARQAHNTQERRIRQAEAALHWWYRNQHL